MLVVFAVISIIQILFTIKFCFQTLEEIPKYKLPDYMPKIKRLRTIFNTLIEFVYMGYLLYVIVIQWA